jgi:hypothetical protein
MPAQIAELTIGMADSAAERAGLTPTPPPAHRRPAHPPPRPARRRPELQVEQAQRRELATFCGALLDKFEDDIFAALKNDDFGTEQGGWAF